MSKELKSLNESDFSTHANFVEAQTRITTKYTTLKAIKTAELEETATYNGHTYKHSDFLKSHEKTITLKDAAGNTLLSFVCYAPDATTI